MRIISLILLALTAATVGAQDDAPSSPGDFEGKTIKSIEFIGAPNTRPEWVLSKMKTNVGRPYVRADADEDVKFLRSELRLFSTIEYRPIKDNGGVRLAFYVTENPRIYLLGFVGNQEFTKDELLESVASREGGLADDITLELDRKAVRDRYLDEGFHFVQVQVERQVEEGGSSVVFKITEGEQVCIVDVTFEGNSAFEKSKLLEAMPTTDESGLISTTNYVETRVQADLVQLQQFYRGSGYKDATVLLYDRRFSTDRSEAALRIRVVEGEPYIVRSVEIRGMTRFDADVAKAAMKTRVGGRYESFFDVADDIRELERNYREDAYIDANVVDQSALDPERPEVDVIFDVREGQRSKVNRVVMRGNVETQDRVVRRLLKDIVPGGPLNLEALERGQQRIQSLQYFDPESVEILKPVVTERDYRIYQDVFIEIDDTDQEHVKNVFVDLKEKDTGSLRFAVGAGSNNGLFGAITYTKTNFDPLDFPESFDDIFDAFVGGGQFFQVNFTPGTELTQASVRYEHPFIFDSDYRFSFNGSKFFRFRENWDEDRLGMRIGIGRNFGYNISATLTYRLELVDVSDIDSDAGQIVFDFEGENLISSVIARLNVADLDSPIRPTEGYRFSLQYEFAGLGGDIDFHKILFDATYFSTLSEDADGRKHVLRATATIGWAQETGDTRAVPIYERFFAGGHGSIRGFDFRGVGPMSNGSPDGGQALILGSVEYTFPLYEELLRGAFFVDGGTVAEDWGDSDITNFRLAAGFGIRLSIPFLGPTPFAVDFGIPLLRDDDDDTRVFSFSIEREF